MLLLGHLSVTIGTHYCMGTLVSSEWMIGQENMSCGMTSMDSQSDQSGIQMDCCNNEYVSLENGDLFKKKIAKSQISIRFVAVLAYVLDVQQEVYDQPTLANYSLPPPDIDLNLRYQRLLI